MESNYVVIVPSKLAQQSRQILEEKGIWDETRRFKSVDNCRIAIPVLTNTFDLKVLSDILEDEVEISKMDLSPSKKTSVKSKRPASVLKENLKEFVVQSGKEWSRDLEDDLPKSWERHGDLVLFHEGCFRSPIWKDQGTESKLWNIVARSLSCKRLAIKSVINDNGFRTPQVQLVLGDKGWVEQVDNKLRFTYDITKCMFSIGNITEKLRLAQFNCSGETVVDLYAGIGYFTIPYLVHAGAKHVHACEWNPDAVEALKKNLRLNQVEDRCTVYPGDNRKVCPVNIADRVNLGLIPSSEDGWPVACSALKKHSGGFLHIHANVTSLPQASSKPTSNDVCDNSFSDNQESINIPKCTSNDVCRSKSVNTNSVSSGNSTSYDVCSKSHNSSQIEERIKLPKDDCGKSLSEKLVSDQVPDSKTIWNQWAESTAIKIRTMLYELHQTPWTAAIHHIEHVKSYAPHVDHLVLDLECRPLT